MFAVVYGLTATGLVVVVVGGSKMHLGVVVGRGSGIGCLCSMLSWAVVFVGDVVVVVVVVVVVGNVVVDVRIVEGWEGIVVCESIGSCYVGGLVVRVGRWRGRRWLRCLGSDLTILGCG